MKVLVESELTIHLRRVVEFNNQEELDEFRDTCRKDKDSVSDLLDYENRSHVYDIWVDYVNFEILEQSE